MSRANNGSVVDARPILVSGVYRSGTTFLAALLGAHPKLRASSSTIKFLRFCLGRFGDMANAENRCALVEDCAARVEKRWKLKLNSKAVLSTANAHSTPSYALMYDLMMRDMLCNDEDEDVRWVEKLAVQWSGIPAFLDMFPNGRVVHIIRDPRDVTTSYKLMTFEPGNTYLDAAFNCRSSMESMYTLDEKYRDRVLVIRGEDIANAIEESVIRLCEFLGLENSDPMLDINNLHTEGEEWATNTSHGGRFDKWPEAKPRWPEHLSKTETMFIELITQPYFSAYGYAASGYIPDAKEWSDMYALLDDEFLQQRFSNWLVQGKGAEGYRTDPYEHEMKIVFPERYQSTVNLTD